MRAKAKSTRIKIAAGIVLSVIAVMQAATAVASSGSCPNLDITGFRASLPECGAYELVTPPYKDGGAALDPEAISADGSRVITSSLGGYAGAEGDVAGAFYQSIRSQSGWTSSTISPPASRFPAYQGFGISADLNTTLWALREPSQSANAEDLYRRETDGSFVEVGPMVPPYASDGTPAGSYSAFAKPLESMGASPDLSHVLFQAASYYEALWPGDTTFRSPTAAANSLYEYVGTGNSEPILVGIDNSGELISKCASVLGSIEGSGEDVGYNRDTYNAISASGETVFFTAQECGEPIVNEVYARIGQTPVDTIPISEPTFSACEACQTGVSTPRHGSVPESAAEFQGASEDGSKAFFLTEQELFEKAVTRNLYEYDFDAPAGEKVTRISSGEEAPEVQGVARVSEDGSHVYFVAKGTLTGANREGVSPVEEGYNLYVYQRDSLYPAGNLTFIATLARRDKPDWRANDSERPVQTTPTGEFLVFDSIADLTPGDNSTEEQVFEYDATTEELVRVSTAEAGYAEGAESAEAHPSSIPAQVYARAVKPAAATTDLAVSSNGHTVVFVSNAGLTPAAAAASEVGVQSVYEYRSGVSLSNGAVALISGGSTLFSATTEGLDPSGQDVFLKTAAPLVSSDVDSQFDVYDERAFGGFAGGALPTECEARVLCQGTAPELPALVSPGTVTDTAGGNVTASHVALALPAAKRPTRGDMLAKALSACRRRPKTKRVACEKQARRKYGPTRKQKGRR